MPSLRRLPCGSFLVFLTAALFVACFLLPSSAVAQTELAGIYGRVTDQSGAVIVDAEVEIKNVETNLSVTVKTNQDGLYTIPSLHPGHYLISARKPGFKTVTVTQLDLNVQDNVVRNFSLQVGSIAETVTITADDLHINTTDAAVSTVVDRQFAENLPMNGRSFQSLIDLTPGVVLTVNSVQDSGQFSVNGQRAVSNYWMLDGVSANIGLSSRQTGNGLGGALGSFSAQGGTNSLVSVDAMQEFRIQTSTYAPEFGRTPGAQISIVTRSGANQLHGTAFDYLRNDLFDANDWFANSKGLRKPPERQNDFGGTFSGPIFKNRTFFFFSYEGLRLRLPQTALTTVPCDNTCTVFGNARTMAISQVQPFLNAFPLPNGPEVFKPCTPGVNGCPASGEQSTGTAQFNGTFSNKSTLDAYSLRIDQKASNKVTMFARYNNSPSETTGRGGGALSVISPVRITTQTATAGSTWAISDHAANDFRFNYSRTSSSSRVSLDNFGGATPPTSFPFPGGVSGQDSHFTLAINSLRGGNSIGVGNLQENIQRQINVVDNFSLQVGAHSLKFGIDFRRLTPFLGLPTYSQSVTFSSVASADSGSLARSTISSGLPATLLFRNLGFFAEDTWRAAPRLTLTYGIRWDMDFVPSSVDGPTLMAVTGFNQNDLSGLALAPAGTPPFGIPYNNVAPRFGAAYQLHESKAFQTVIRGGFGVFYDLATSEVGNLISTSYPFGAQKFLPGGSFPLSAASAAPPQLTPPGGGSGVVNAFNPKLKLPYTLEWNLSLEQALGSQQMLSASYIGSAGRRLIVTTASIANPNFAQVNLVTNEATSDYDALQLQFQRRLSRGLQVLASYTWSHSIDDASAGSAFGNLANALVTGLAPHANRGPSDFDIRHSFSGGLTYEVPSVKNNLLTRILTRGWSAQNFIVARSAPPVTITDLKYFEINAALAAVRPDLVPGQPLYLYGSQYPGGKAFNPAAFADPPAGVFGPNCPFGGCPARQGTTPRNFLRGFGATQWDFAVHRDFPIHEWLKLQFRTEMFNVLNHPNFGSPSGFPATVFGVPGFGISNQILGQSLSGTNINGGPLSPLYQIGGPRSIQLALKLMF